MLHYSWKPEDLMNNLILSVIERNTVSAEQRFNVNDKVSE